MLETNKCNHINNDGTSAIEFPSLKWKGISPYTIKGICRICYKNIELTKDEYQKLRKG